MHSKHLNIVIADDDSDDHLLAQQAINELGVDSQIFSVYDGFQLLDLLLKRKSYETDNSPLPDLILLDINMPLLNGFGALAQIKANDQLKNIPIYVLSTSHSKTDMLLARRLGADGFYTKPILFEHLKRILDEIVTFAETHH
jgi:CheY-like chemotaxis protein